MERDVIAEWASVGITPDPSLLQVICRNLALPPNKIIPPDLVWLLWGEFDIWLLDIRLRDQLLCVCDVDLYDHEFDFDLMTVADLQRLLDASRRT